jgi:hypothetical protein
MLVRHRMFALKLVIPFTLPLMSALCSG